MKLIRCISASAGTGKTHRINSIITSLVSSGVNPASILCITFTKHSANEMQNRYYTSTNNTTKTPHFKTIHGFANHLLDEKLNILCEEEQEDIIKEAIEIICSDKKWIDFFKSSEYEFSNIVSDMKHMISNNMLDESDQDASKLIDQTLQPTIELSKKCQSDLVEAKLTGLLEKILSNDYGVYQNQIITKNHRINKRLVPDSFLNNTKYTQSSKEIQKVLKIILSIVINNENKTYLKESLMINLFMRQVFEKYKMIKKVKGVADYSEIISNSLEKINLEKIMPISHIFLDEAQDTTPHQWNFIMSIIAEIFQKDDASFTIVGDEKQIIYQFNGSSENYYQKTKSKLKKMISAIKGQWIEEVLDKSYRSPEVILDFIDSIMQVTKYPTKHRPASEKSGYIKTWDQPEFKIRSTCQDWKIQEKPKIPEWINTCIDEIKRLVQTDLLNENRKVEYSDITVLIGKRCQNTLALMEEIKKSGIPIKESPFYLIQNETIQEILSISEFVLNTESDLILISILRGPFFRFSYEEIEMICIDRQSSVWEKMLTIENEKIQNAVKKIQEWILFPKDAFGFYSTLIFHNDYGKLMQDMFYEEILLFWESLLEFNEKYSSLSEFVIYMKNSKKGFRSNINGISICTIHASKGRENNIIFLCTSEAVSKKQTSLNLIYNNILLVKGNYKMYKQAKTRDMLVKELEVDRLLYVALTRAREQIYILPPGEIPHQNSWYLKILQNISLFKKNGNQYEIFSQIETKQANKTQ